MTIKAFSNALEMYMLVVLLTGDVQLTTAPGISNRLTASALGNRAAPPGLGNQPKSLQAATQGGRGATQPADISHLGNSSPALPG